MKQQNERAVSPVVGVMLMLVVVIIIAAVVSGFAGSLVGGNNQKVPQLAMDVNIQNSGYWSTSYFRAVVTGVDAPIYTRNLKIITSWKKSLANGTTIKGGATIIPGVRNFNVIYDTHGGGAYDDWQIVVPQGYGPGVGQNVTCSGNIFWPADCSHSLMSDFDTGKATNYTWYGNYYLQAGTSMLSRPFGGEHSGQSAGNMQYGVGYGVNATRYQYVYGSYGVTTCAIGTSPNCHGAIFNGPKTSDGQDPLTYSMDQMQGTLGYNWEILRPGDIVSVKVIHIPTGKTIWQKDVVVEGVVG